ncbi:MAG: hypothetical protein K5655_04220 [Lachnospiraceae bacterium]|nr:hypothetical protein [Lachnospiraceae bacterium]
MRRLTNEECRAKLIIKNPNIELLGEYINNSTQTLFYCKKHDRQFYNVPAQVFVGTGCSLCTKENVGNARRKTQEEYLNKLQTKNPNIVPLEKYKTINTPILHKCLIHNIEWNVTPGNVLSGEGCSKCRSNKIADKARKTHEQYVNELKDIHPNIVPLENYIDGKTYILHKCLNCEYEWMAKPIYLFHATTNCCPNCGEHVRKSHDLFVKLLQVRNPNIEILGTFTNADNVIKCRCKTHNYIWEASGYRLLNGSSCPKCIQSQGEKKIANWLMSHNIDYRVEEKFSECKDEKPLPFDFYLPSENRCIEYDGVQHFEPIDHFGGQKKFEYTQRHDQIKNEYCENNNIPLLRIPYYADINEELTQFLLN